jgi:hypothetical protein
MVENKKEMLENVIKVCRKTVWKRINNDTWG